MSHQVIGEAHRTVTGGGTAGAVVIGSFRIPYHGRFV